MAGRPRTTSDDQILTATARAISAVGPSELTLAHVAREAGIAPATIVQRFGSKRALLLAFTARASVGVEEGFTAAQRRHPSPLRALVGHLIAMASGMRTPDELSRHLAFLQLELGDPEFRQHTRRHADVMREQIRVLLEAAVDGGELRPCDTKRLADALYVTYNGALITWAILRRGSLARHLRRELEFVLEPYRTTERRSVARVASATSPVARGVGSVVSKGTFSCGSAGGGRREYLPDEGGRPHADSDPNGG
jgi:AcrR family transcriptional regulator